jgi:hypothetical protein
MNMTQPITSKRFFRFVVAFTLLLLGYFAIAVVDFITHPFASSLALPSPFVRGLVALIVVPICIAIAVLVLRRAPWNVCGLFLLQWSTIIMAQTIRTGSGLESYSSLNLGWVGLWLLFVYFPDGRPYPRRFEKFINFLSVGLILSTLLWAFSIPMMPTWYLDGQVVNALSIPALASLQPLIGTLEMLFLVAIFVVVILSVILRYRGSSFAVHQQLKWLAWVGILAVVSSLIVGSLGITTRAITSLNQLELLIMNLWSAFITLMPYVAVGNAILRYRLYDIDIIIRRTLIYSVLTGILAAIYFGGVIITQQLFQAVTGDTPDIAIVLSTLLLAALFNPLRRRIQDVIDRRLYRRKYDVEQTLAQFNQSLRDEVDVQTLSANLIGVVSDTMQPDKIALWVKDSG